MDIACSNRSGQSTETSFTLLLAWTDISKWFGAGQQRYATCFVRYVRYDDVRALVLQLNGLALLTFYMVHCLNWSFAPEGQQS